MDRDQQIADLMPPLEGYAVFADAEERLSTVAVEAGATGVKPS